MSDYNITMYDRNGYPRQVDPRDVTYKQNVLGWTLENPDDSAGEAFLDSDNPAANWIRENPGKVMYGLNPMTWGFGYLVDQAIDAGEGVSANADQFPNDAANIEDFEYGASIGAGTMTMPPGLVEELQSDYMMQVDGQYVWKSGMDEEAVQRLVRNGYSEKEANALIRDAQSLIGGVDPTGRYVNVNRSQITDPTQPGGGGGGGYGRVGPTYTPPDRRAVEESVRNQMVTLLGAIEAQSVDGIVNAYMRDHRKAWEGASLDPNMTMLEELRNLDSYKKIHKLRPDSASEATWVSQHRGAWAQGGGRVGQAEKKAQQLATIGATASTDNTQLSEFGSGFATDTFKNRMAGAAKTAVGKLV